MSEWKPAEGDRLGTFVGEYQKFPSEQTIRVRYSLPRPKWQRRLAWLVPKWRKSLDSGWEDVPIQRTTEGNWRVEFPGFSGLYFTDDKETE
jgi:hypothetical protein